MIIKSRNSGYRNYFNNFSNQKTVLLIVILVLLFRIAFGLLRGFIHDPDHQYIYTLGLKYFTTGAWSFFGPDVVYTNSQIPGALQALWVAIPLRIFPIPESPYFFYLLAVMFALGFLAWYVSKLELSLPKEIIWIWVLTTPWSILFCSTIINPGYVMIYAVFFMVVLFEQVRLPVVRVIPKTIGFFLMGFCTTQIMQLHLSWVLLLPLLFLALLVEYVHIKITSSNTATSPVLVKNYYPTILKDGGIVLVGLLVGGVTLYPTIIKHGLEFSGGIDKNIIFNYANFNDFFKTWFNFLYFPSYNVINRFNFYSFTLTVVEKNVLTLWQNYWWTVVVFVIPYIFGIVQISLYLLGLFTLVPLKNLKWAPIRLLLIGTIILVWLGFFFNDSGNTAHKYLMFFPLAVIYSLYVLEWMWQKKYFRLAYGVALFFMLFAHGVIAVDAYRDQENNYHFYRNREKIVSAIRERDYTIYSTTRYDDYTNHFQKQNIGEPQTTQSVVRPGY